ncbi:MAG TPA: hypothetical protein DCG34_03690 [Clostridiales bacterium]|jgi:hypothetical protein|nr:hypothetical protein [Clostridiales bacterium]
MRFKIFFDKPANGNPYYANNKELHSLSMIINEINKNEVLKDKLSYTGIIGGQRNRSAYECEVTLELAEKQSELSETIIEILKEITVSNGGKYLIEEVRTC